MTLAGLPALLALASAAEGAAVERLRAEGDVVLLAIAPRRPGERARVRAFDRVAAPCAAVAAVIADPAAYRRAVPALVRLRPIEGGRAPGEAAAPATDAGADRRDPTHAWELEIPLWNLDGAMRMSRRGGDAGVDLDFVAGDLAPGRFALSTSPGTDAGTCLLSIDARANVRDAHYLARKLAARSPFAEHAMTATAAFVLLRALAIESESRAGSPVTGDPPRVRWPRADMSAPAGDQGIGAALGRLLDEDPWRETLALAAVRSRPDGRLDHVAVAAASPGAAEELARAVRDPARWRSLPGWREIKVERSPEASAKPASKARWKVDVSLPLVDLDVTWQLAPGPAFRARAVAGDTAGAFMGWDVAAAPAGGGLGVFLLHPRFDRAGYLPRKLIEAEPLLEHGMALGLAIVDALAFVTALPAPRSPR